MTLAEAIELRKAGHAVSISEVWDSEGKRERFIIEHYRTCEVCRQAEIARSRGQREYKTGVCGEPGAEAFAPNCSEGGKQDVKV